MKKARVLFLFIAILLSGCVTTYHPEDLTGGYSDKQISLNIMQVTYNGNGLTNVEQTYKYAMRRAAQQTIGHGYRYFKVISNKNFMISSSTIGPNFLVLQHESPRTIIKYTFEKHKTVNNYDAKKVLEQTKLEQIK